MPALDNGRSGDASDVEGVALGGQFSNVCVSDGTLKDT